MFSWEFLQIKVKLWGLFFGRYYLWSRKAKTVVPASFAAGAADDDDDDPNETRALKLFPDSTAQ